MPRLSFQPCGNQTSLRSSSAVQVPASFYHVQPQDVEFGSRNSIFYSCSFGRCSVPVVDANLYEQANSILQHIRHTPTGSVLCVVWQQQCALILQEHSKPETFCIQISNVVHDISVMWLETKLNLLCWWTRASITNNELAWTELAAPIYSFALASGFGNSLLQIACLHLALSPSLTCVLGSLSP